MYIDPPPPPTHTHTTTTTHPSSNGGAALPKRITEHHQDYHPTTYSIALYVTHNGHVFCTVQSSEHGVSVPGITHRTHLCKDSFPSKRYCRVYITVLSAIVYILRRITCIKHGCTRYAWRGFPTLEQTVPEERKDKS